MTPPARPHPAGPPPDESEPRPADCKSTLFCPECGHESVIDGDWVVEDDHDQRVRDVSCPRCSTHITGRPLPADSDSEGPSTDSTATRAVSENWSAWTTVWLSTVRFWVRCPPTLDAGRAKC